MKILKQISFTFIFFLICLFEIYLNTFINLDFGIYIFFIALVYIGAEFFNQNIVFSIFLSGILYDSFFSTYYLGLYSSIFILVVILANFLVSKYNKSNITYFAVISICLLIYKSPLFFEFDYNYWLSSYVLSIIINFIVFLFLKRISRINV